MRFNFYFLKTGRITIYAKYSYEKFNIRTGSPGMAIGPGIVDIRNFRPGSQSHFDIFPPLAQPAQVVITKSCLYQRSMQVDLK